MKRGAADIVFFSARVSRALCGINVHDQKNPVGACVENKLMMVFPFESSTLLSGFCPLCLRYNRDKSVAVGPLDGASDYRWYVGEIQRRCGDCMYGADLDVCLSTVLFEPKRTRDNERISTPVWSTPICKALSEGEKTNTLQKSHGKISGGAD